MPVPAYLGIDIGTSGIRGCVIDGDKNEILHHHLTMAAQIPVKGKNEQSPAIWLVLLHDLLTAISDQLSKTKAPTGDGFEIRAISLDGTSSTIIACKKDGTALSPALMYNDQQSKEQALHIRELAPADSAVHGASSSLSKALKLLNRYPDTELFCHQADWLASDLTGIYGISDENNCLKLGYDSLSQQWPEWLKKLLPESLLPQVLAPGETMAPIKADLVTRYRLAPDCVLIAGTTDSIAATLASGACQIGDAVTSLGSTLVLKLFSDRPLFSAKDGIYSHRINDHWLVGGASNTGGTVLLEYFSVQQMEDMTLQLTPDNKTGLDYYPLPDTGERFPVNDPLKQNRVTPRPKSDVQFFQGLLEGIANIEAQGYKKLIDLGATEPTRIYSTGGGSKNQAWSQIREKTTGIKMLIARESEASYGSALLARQGFISC